MGDTIAAIATGMAVTAIGIVRVSGPRAIEAAERVFSPADGRPLGDHRARQLVYGELRGADGAAIDLCLATVSRAPHSYTGEDTAELQCHGSPAVLRAALEAAESGLTPDAVLTEAEEALQALGELTGRTVRDDVVDRIFERFCVGK